MAEEIPQLSQAHAGEAYLPDRAPSHWPGSTAAAKWYAVFTLAHHERRVSERCTQREVESFLPLYKTRRKWKNRCTVDLELPLFPNYFFVRIPPRNRVQVLQLPGVVSIVSSSGQPLPLPDDYISALRDGLRLHKIEPRPSVEPGEKVRITTGPLAGAEGMLERHKNGFRVLLTLEMLARSISVEVGADEIELCRERSGFNLPEAAPVTTLANRTAYAGPIPGRSA